MLYRNFKGEQVSLLGFGFMRPPMCGGRIDMPQLQDMVDIAIKSGINYFDTAYIYWRGNSEVTLGKMLAKHDRSKINIATKLMLGAVKTQAELEECFQIQLERLNTTYIDYYLFHMVTSSRWEIYTRSNLFDFLNKKKSQGKIRHIGFSFHDTPDFLTMVCGAYPWDFAQIQLNYMDWTVQKAREQYEICEQRNIPVWVMEPVRGGELARLDNKATELLLSATTGSGSPAAHALRWAMSPSQVVCVLSGMSSIEQVNENIKITENFKPVTNKDKELLQKVIELHLSSGAVHCSGCAYCVPNCPRNIDIPSTFTFYNDHLRNGTNFFRLYGRVSPNRQAKRCVNCGRCRKYCPQHIDIPAELTKINLTIANMKSKMDNKRKKNPSS